VTASSWQPKARSDGPGAGIPLPADSAGAVVAASASPRGGASSQDAGSPVRPQPPGGGGWQLARLAFDIGAPIAVYYLLHSLRAGNLTALAAGAAFPAASAAYGLVVKRRADGVAVFMLVTIAASVIASAIARDPRFLLARDGLITGLWGLWFLASTGARRPAAFLFARPLMEGRKMYSARDWDALWRGEPAFRRIWRVSTVMWGTGLLADAVTRVAMSYTLPVGAVPALGGALWPVTFLLLQVITNVYYHFAGLNRLLGARWLARRQRRSGSGPQRTGGQAGGRGIRLREFTDGET
jgi:membrane protein implicated in regulation of membrane protease activity